VLVGRLGGLVGGYQIPFQSLCAHCLPRVRTQSDCLEVRAPRVIAYYFVPAALTPYVLARR
jgi:hypothetical protein